MRPACARLASALLALTFLLPAAAGEALVDAELGARYDDNLSRAQRQGDIQADRILSARAALGRVFAVGLSDAVLRAEARIARHARHAGLDSIALGARAGWRRKLGLGRTAPWIAADGALFEERHDADVRDGRRALVSLTLGKRFGDRLAAALSLAYEARSQREARPMVPRLPGDPFSLQGRTLAAEASWALDDKILLFAAAALRRGDVVSSTRRNPDIFRESAAIAEDPAFGADFIAYRLTGARTRSVSLGVSWALGRHAALEAAAARDITAARGGLDYDGNVYRLTLVYRK